MCCKARRDIISNDIDPSTINDEGLSKLLKARDARALTVLAYRFAARLEAMLKRKFSSLIPPEDLKDIVAETMIRAFKTGERFDPKIASAFTWINMLGHYEALQFLRKTDLTDNTLDEIADRIAARTEIESPEDAPQPSTRMVRLLAQLSPQRAKLIRMHYYDGLSIDQIADLLGLTRGGVKSTLSRARHQLKGLYREDQDDREDVDACK